MADTPREKPVDPIQQECESQNERKDAMPIFRSELQIPHSIIDAYNAKQEKEARRERWKLRIEVATLIAIAVYAFMAYRQWDAMRDAAVATKKSAEIAEKTLLATQRPWVYVRMEIKSDLTFTGTGSKIDILYSIINVGHSPAVDVHLSIKMFPSIAFGRQREIEESVCSKENWVPSLQNILGGSVLFPNEEHTVIFPTQEDISGVNKTAGIVLFPEIIGCVTYRFAGGEPIHTTRFIAHLKIFDPRNPDFVTGIPAEIGTVPSSQLRLSKSVTYAD
jgi:hypothetical protein